MKKLLLFILALTLALSLLVSCGDNNASKDGDKTESESESESETKPSSTEINEEEGNGLEYELLSDRKSYAIIGKGSYPDAELVIPSTYRNKPVTEIAASAFEGITDISSVVFESNVTVIRENAFAKMPALKSVTLSDSITTIEKNAFFRCPELESVTFGKGLVSLGSSAFEQCFKLKSAALPESLTELPDSAFFECTELSEITVGSSLKKIGSSVFDGTAFYLNSENWSDGALYIGNALIKVNDNVGEKLNVKEGTVIIADHTANRSDIKELTLPSSLKYIGGAAFAACKNVETVDIPEGVISLGFSAFSSCHALVNLTLPSTLETMGDHVFYHCASLETVVIPEKITVLPERGFDMCESLKSIKLPSNLKKLELHAISNCYSLTKVELPKSVESIGNYAFYKNYNMTSINIPEKVTAIRASTFLYCYKLVDIKNESQIQITPGEDSNGSVGKFAFEIHNGESKIDVVSDFAFYSFEGTNYLVGYYGEETDVTLPENYKGEPYALFRYAFYYNKNVKSVTIPVGISKIDSNTFDYCVELEKITLTKDITLIKNHAFANTYKLKTVVFLGSEEEFNAITIETANNSTFLNAEKIYNG